LISAAGVIMLIPMVLFFLLLQRRFVAGLTAGGLAG
jgi:raffinose/stachyose/melibiose transport system permease protein